MADSTDFSHIWETQKSLTEWLEDIGHAETEKIRQEDNDKRERLSILNDVIGLPFDRPVKFTAVDLATSSKKFQAYLQRHGDELCALRLIPEKPGLPKLRMRGKTVAEAYEWFKTLDIESADYRVDFLGQEKVSRWATIFVVNQHGIHGEIIYGRHLQLTQGFHNTDTPKVFHYDFKQWRIEPENAEALAYVKKLAAYLHVADAKKQAKITQKLHGTFAHGYLEGYFETTDSEEFGTWFIDYSPSLGQMYADLQIQPSSARTAATVKGQTGCAGTAEGAVFIVDPGHIDVDTFPDRAVLVCRVTTPQYVPLMKKAAAIVTDHGGILSHAAIVARELKKPCIVGTGNATALLRNGQAVHVNADAGTVEASLPSK